jgi:hypothetical protein
MLPTIVLILAATAYRICYALAGAPASWANFSPVAAILLCSAAYLPRKALLLVALGPLFVADLLLNAHYHAPLIDTGMLSRYFSFALIVLLGFALRQKHKYKALRILAATVAGSCLVFVTRLFQIIRRLVAGADCWPSRLSTYGLLFPQHFLKRSALHRALPYDSSSLRQIAGPAFRRTLSGDTSPTVARPIHDYGNSGTSRRRRG